MKVETNFKEMYLVDKFLYDKILNSSQTFNNLSSKFNVINRVPPTNVLSHPNSSSKEDNISMKRDDGDRNQVESKQIDNVENKEQGNGNNIYPPNNVHSKAERTYPNQIEQMQIDNPLQQLTHSPNIVHKAERTYPNQIGQM